MQDLPQFRPASNGMNRFERRPHLLIAHHPGTLNPARARRRDVFRKTVADGKGRLGTGAQFFKRQPERPGIRLFRSRFLRPSRSAQPFVMVSTPISASTSFLAILVRIPTVRAGMQAYNANYHGTCSFRCRMSVIEASICHPSSNHGISSIQTY